MLKILAVCTGNICRSPLAAQVLQHRMSDLGVHTDSAGTRARDGVPITPEAMETGVAMGAVPEVLAQHRSRHLAVKHLEGVDLTLAMAREHRREIVELAPAQMRRCFTLREFARLMNGMSDAEVRDAAATNPVDSRARLAGALGALNARRGLVLPPPQPEDDDVVDPYRRSRAVYEEAARQLKPALAAVERLIRLVEPEARGHAYHML